MTHSHPLHRPIDVECQCCRLVTRFEFGSWSDLVVCKGCKRHYGELKHQLWQANLDHLGMWKSELTVMREEHAAEIARLKAKIVRAEAELRQMRLELTDAQHAIETQLRDGPLATVEAWWNSLVIAEANDKRDAAYRSRDHAVRVLWHLDKLHHDGGQPNHCSCGKTTSKCKEWQLMDEHRSFLYSWERKQIERLEDDLDHGLPDDHPEVLKRVGSSYRPFRRHG